MRTGHVAVSVTRVTRVYPRPYPTTLVNEAYEILTLLTGGR